MSRRVQVSVRVNILVTCDAEMEDGEVTIVSVSRVSLPEASEVMEAIDAEDGFDRLDEAYERAIEGATT